MYYFRKILYAFRPPLIEGDVSSFKLLQSKGRSDTYTFIIDHTYPKEIDMHLKFFDENDICIETIGTPEGYTQIISRHGGKIKYTKTIEPYRGGCVAMSFPKRPVKVLFLIKYQAITIKCFTMNIPREMEFAAI